MSRGEGFAVRVPDLFAGDGFVGDGFVADGVALDGAGFAVECTRPPLYLRSLSDRTEPPTGRRLRDEGVELLLIARLDELRGVVLVREVLLRVLLREVGLGV